MIPLRDNLPTARFPVLTVALIVINVAVFIWQATLSQDPGTASDRSLSAAGVSDYDEAVLEFGAIPFRVLHPSGECGVVERGRAAGNVACASEPEADAIASGDAGVAPLDAVPWWVTVLTAMFMHGGILHLAFNMLFLWVFGNNIEDSLGRPRFILFYLLAGAVAVYAQSLLDPNSAIPTIGASGAIAGVLGGYALLHPQARVLTLVIIIFFITFIEIPALLVLGIWFVLQFLPVIDQLGTEATGEGGVAYLAHVGGFVFGLATIKLFVAGRAPPGVAH